MSLLNGFPPNIPLPNLNENPDYTPVRFLITKISLQMDMEFRLPMIVLALHEIVLNYTAIVIYWSYT